MRRRNSPAAKLALLVAGTAVSSVLAEVVYRALAPDEIGPADLNREHRIFCQNEQREEVSLTEGIEQGLVLRVDPAPRVRYSWASSSTFYLCYAGAQQPYFDEQGCVPCTLNSLGVRDREELCGPKPQGQRRIVCLGDSFTFGWGVRVEDAWPQLCEAILRRTDDGIRTVNCGAARGAMFVDEYWWGLKHHFHRFEPDAVLVSLCLNDLIPSNGALAHVEQRPWLLRQSRILRDLFQDYSMQAALSIDPGRDLVQELLDLPEELYPMWARMDVHQVGRAALWPGGGPQAALRSIRDWCAERGIPMGVSIWPYFQGLGEHEHYPFEKIHRLVGEFCAAEGIPFLDLLPAFRGQRTPDLWVSPADFHGNDKAQELAAEPVARFLLALLDG